MKLQIKHKKWFLPTLLIGALAIQYHYTVSSVDIAQSIDMASRAPSNAPPITVSASPGVPVAASADNTTRRASADVTVAASTDSTSASGDSTAVAANASGDGTEAATTFCAQCEIQRLNNQIAQQSEQLNRIEQRLSTAPAPAPAAAPAVAPAPAAAPAAVAETPAEAARRARDEARTAREDARRQRAEDARYARLDREDEFKDKVDDIKSRCGDDTECTMDEFSSLLDRYTGSKAISLNVVNRAYQNLIGRNLTDSLNTDQAGSQQLLAAITGADFPSEYSSIKRNAVSAVQQNLTDLRDQYNRTRDVNVSQSFISNRDLYTRALLTGANNSGDTALQNYIRSNFSTEVASLFNSMNFSGTNTNGTATNTRTRGAFTATAPATPTNLGASGATMIQSLPSTNSGTVTFGAPISNPGGLTTFGTPGSNGVGSSRTAVRGN